MNRQTGRSGDVAPDTATAAGESLRLILPGNVAMEYVWCPPGTFTMGSPNDELGQGDWDGPQHAVTLAHGFWMARFPTTQRQYVALVGSNPSGHQGDALPVEQVDWPTAVAFCEKVNARLGSALPEGFRCSLPTEAQWEYACRAGTTGPLNSGRELTSDCEACANLNALAWCEANSDERTHAVGKKRPNAWGLYDMHGNVWEWCRDWFDDYAEQSQTDPTGPKSGASKVGRGGSWDDCPGECRSAYRSQFEPNSAYPDLGFRPVLTFVEPARGLAGLLRRWFGK